MYRFVVNEKSYHGRGSVEAIAEEVSTRGFKKAFICADPDLVKFHVTDKVLDILKGGYLDYYLYTNIKPNPTIENVMTGVEAFKQSGADYIIAIGGGSSMDTAKAIGILIRNPDRDIRSLEGKSMTMNRSVPIMAIPTTAGTASEVTIAFVITDPERNRKFICEDANVIPIVAFIDPVMMSSMPRGLTAATGMDALTHAIEGYISKGSWVFPDMYAIDAIKLISESLRSACDNDPKGREGMALAQYLAGICFSNSGLGITHSMAHSLGGLYHTPHGVANAILLPTVMEFNAPNTGEKYRNIARAMGIHGTSGMTADEYRNAAIDAVRQLAADVGIPQTLKGIAKKEDLPFLAKSAMADACRPSNPREVTEEDIIKLYSSLL